jgi:(4-O-methyl)-D-glucuronate---lignin esterase
MFASQTIRLAAAALALTTAVHAGRTAAAQTPAPTAAQQATQEATQADHQRMLALLGITEIRRGVEGRNPQSPNFANYDESKVAPYPPLPELMVTKAGTRVTTAAQWWKVRRPELVELFDREVYGRMPKATPKVSWSVTGTSEETVGGVTMIKKALVGTADNRSYPEIAVNIEAAVWTPKLAKGPVPIVLEFGSGGRPQPPRPAAPAAAAAAPPAAGATASQAGRPATPGPTWQEQVVAKGWGYASIRPASIQADNGAGLTAGIIGLVNKGQPRKADDWGALKAWTWGTSRLLDYFETDKAVDAQRVVLEGHSRYGKATIVAMAYEPRLAVAFISSSGAGGAKIMRRTYGELVENVAASSEYHWMAGNFLKYAGPLTANDLPVDAHQLVAMCAPRPVFISGGDTLGGVPAGDGWVDSKGMFLAGVYAGPVYKLLGKKDLGTTEFPAIETALVDGEIGFRQHTAGHTPGPNWPTFLTFAERYFMPKPKGSN